MSGYDAVTAAPVRDDGRGDAAGHRSPAGRAGVGGATGAAAAAGGFFRVVVEVDLRPGSLDAQGEAVRSALRAMGYGDVAAVRVGKRIELDLQAATAEAAADRAREMAERLLANPVLEVFRVRVEPAAGRRRDSRGRPAAAARH